MFQWTVVNRWIPWAPSVGGEVSLQTPTAEYIFTSKLNSGSSFTSKVYTCHVVRTTSRVQGHQGPFLLPRRFGFIENETSGAPGELRKILIFSWFAVIHARYSKLWLQQTPTNRMYAQSKRWFQFLTCSNEFGWMDPQWQLRCDRPEPSRFASL